MNKRYLWYCDAIEEMYDDVGQVANLSAQEVWETLQRGEFELMFDLDDLEAFLDEVLGAYRIVCLDEGASFHLDAAHAISGMEMTVHRDGRVFLYHDGTPHPMSDWEALSRFCEMLADPDCPWVLLGVREVLRTIVGHYQQHPQRSLFHVGRLWVIPLEAGHMEMFTSQGNGHERRLADRSRTIAG